YGVQNYLTSVAQCPADTSVLLVGGFAYDGVRRTTNSGESFSRVLSDPTFARFWVISDAIVFDPNDANTVYVARGMSENTIHRSRDRGATWEQMSSVPQTVTRRICTMTIRPDSTHIIYLGCQGGIILRSDDSGRTW